MLPEGRGIPWVLKNADDGPERPEQRQGGGKLQEELQRVTQ